MAEFTTYDSRESLEVMLSYLLPGALLVGIYSLLHGPLSARFPNIVFLNLPRDLGRLLLISVLLGPLLRGFDNLLYIAFLRLNIFNHLLWWRYRSLKARYNSALEKQTKHTVMSKMPERYYAIFNRCDSLADGYMWCSALLFCAGAVGLLVRSYCLSIFFIIASWLLLENGLYYFSELIAVMEDVTQPVTVNNKPHRTPNK